MVNSPTHCNHLIDKIFVSRPDVYSCDVYGSILKTKHHAAFLTCAPTVPTSQRSKRKVQLYDMRAPNIDRLRHNLALYPWGNVLHCTDTETLYEHFVNTVYSLSLLNLYHVKMLFSDAGTLSTLHFCTPCYQEAGT